MVAYECSKTTRLEVKEYLLDCDSKLQECALKFLLKNENIDYVLVGMRKSSYVHDIMALKE
ncbi:MAG: hypothetical protein Q9M40_06300 [Sulfurimonas sp.]|nr:hypothetical protein [Sulfurimonas sp.]